MPNYILPFPKLNPFCLSNVAVLRTRLQGNQRCLAVIWKTDDVTGSATFQSPILFQESIKVLTNSRLFYIAFHGGKCCNLYTSTAQTNTNKLVLPSFISMVLFNILNFSSLIFLNNGLDLSSCCQCPHGCHNSILCNLIVLPFRHFHFFGQKRFFTSKILLCVFCSRP